MASNGRSKKPYTGFGIHIQWYRKEGTIGNDYRYV